MTGWIGLSEKEMQEHRGGFIQVVLGLAAALATAIAGGFAVYYQQEAVEAADLANALDLAQWKYANDPMSLTEAERGLLGLNTNISIVKVPNQTSSQEIFWVSFGDPGLFPPPGMFITQEEWNRYRESRGYGEGIGAF